VKQFVLAGAIVLSAPLAQARALTCWNVYARPGSGPVLKAQIVYNDKLQEVKVSERAYGSYSRDPSQNSIVTGKELAGRGPYKGNREFSLNQGARLILPMKLDQKTLKKAVVEKKFLKEANGILILPLNSNNSKFTGSSYLRMSCQEIL